MDLLYKMMDTLKTEENERGAHREKNARCRHTRENKNRAAKIPRWDDACKRDMTQAWLKKEDNATNSAA